MSFLPTQALRLSLVFGGCASEERLRISASLRIISWRSCIILSISQKLWFISILPPP